MARPKKYGVDTARVNLTLPTHVREALKLHMQTRQKEQPGISESECVTDLLVRTLNISGTGAAIDQRAHIETLWNQIQRHGEPMTGLCGSDGLRNALAESLNITPEHQELWRAVPWFILSAVGNDTRFLRAVVNNNRILIPEVDYGDLGQRIADLIIGWKAKDLFGQTKFEFSKPEPGTFDAAINLEYPLTEKVLYLFPFFLTEFRRPWAGVLPYGEHQAIGWIVHKNSGFLDRGELEALRTTGRQDNDEAKRLRLKFLTRLFSRLTSRKTEGAANLVLEDNYLRREMLPLLISNCDHGIPVENFSSRIFWQIETGINDDKSDAVIKQIIEGLKGKPSDVVLFDLGWNKKVAKIVEGNDSHFVIPFNHAQRIPVGIGFSLPTLPFMGMEASTSPRKIIAEAFLDEVRRIARQAPDFAQNLLDNGILFDAKLLNVPPRRESKGGEGKRDSEARMT